MKKMTVTVQVYIDTDNLEVANEVLENADYNFSSNTAGVEILNTEIVEWVNV